MNSIIHTATTQSPVSEWGGVKGGEPSHMILPLDSPSRFELWYEMVAR